MGFEDRMPRQVAPRRPRQHSMTPSADPDGEATASEVGAKVALDDRQGEYRLVFRAMRVPGFPESLEIGRVQVMQTRGPIWTQKTDIQQTPGWRPIYNKNMRRFAVGDGLDLTVCVLRVDLREDLSSDDLERWHAEADSAAGIAVALLDERIAQERIAEDLIVFDRSGEPETAIDHVVRVREFPPTNRMLAAHRRAASHLTDLNLSQPSASQAAFRWYLRGAQEGPTPDAILAFWIALEALAKPPYGTKLNAVDRRRSDVGWVEAAVRRAGRDPGKLDPTVGRLAGLRAEIVHGGIDRPQLLRDGFYALESLTRLLIRDHLDIAAGWSLSPARSNLHGPLRVLAAYMGERFRKTRWEPTDS